MYRLTFAVKKKYPDLQKKRNQRFFIANTHTAIEVVKDKQYEQLSREFGFCIQTSII